MPAKRPGKLKAALHSYAIGPLVMLVIVCLPIAALCLLASLASLVLS